MRAPILFAVALTACGDAPVYVGTYAWTPNATVTIPAGVDVARITPDTREYMLPDLGVLELASEPAPAVGCTQALEGEYAMQGALRDAGPQPNMNMVVREVDWHPVGPARGQVRGLYSDALLTRDDLALRGIVFCAGDRKLNISLTVAHTISAADQKIFDAVVGSIVVH